MKEKNCENILKDTLKGAEAQKMSMQDNGVTIRRRQECKSTSEITRGWSKGLVTENS